MKITQICFPTLAKLPSDPKGPSGHYWLVVLNIKARRFEILDSLASKTEALMMDACHYLIASIKSMWAKDYKLSTLNISDFLIELIESPRQTNT